MALVHMSSVLSLAFSFICLIFNLKFFVWHARNDFRFCDVRPGALKVIAKVRARVSFTCLSFSNVSGRPGDSVISIVSGVHLAPLGLLVMASFLCPSFDCTLKRK